MKFMNRGWNSQHLAETLRVAKSPGFVEPESPLSARVSESSIGSSKMAGEEWTAGGFLTEAPEFHLQMMHEESMILLEHFHDQLPFLDTFYEQDVKMEEGSASNSAAPIESHEHLQIQSRAGAGAFRSWTNSSSVEDHEASCSSNSEARPAEPDFSQKMMFKRMMEIHSSAHQKELLAAAAIRRQQEQQQQEEQQRAALDLQSNLMAAPPRSGYNHMVAERNRRMKEKQLMGTLKSFIPTTGTRKVKSDKISTLQAVIEYIRQLKSQVSHLEQQNKDLEESQTTNSGEMAATMKIDREEQDNMDQSSKSSEDSLSQTLDPAFMLTAEDDQASSSSSVQLRFEMNNRMKPAHEFLIEILSFLEQRGLKSESIDWLKVSSILTITVHSTMDSCPNTVSQLREELEKRLFPEV